MAAAVVGKNVRRHPAKPVVFPSLKDSRLTMLRLQLVAGGRIIDVYGCRTVAIGMRLNEIRVRIVSVLFVNKRWIAAD